MPESPEPATPSWVDYSKLNEAETRQMIDGHLRAAGWEADTETPRFARIRSNAAQRTPLPA